MISVGEAIENKIIDNNNILYTLRCRCGRTLCFSDSFKTIYCSDNNCKYILVNRIMHICNKLDITIGEDDALVMIDKLKFITPYQILMLDELYDSNRLPKYYIQNIDLVVSQIKVAKTKVYKLYNIAEMTGLNEIDSIAKELFFGFNSFDEAFSYIEAGQIAFISDRLGFKSQDSTAISLEIYNKLIHLKDELKLAEIKLNVDNTEKSLKIVIDGSISPFINSNELLEFLNSKYKQKFTLVSNVNDATDVLIRTSSNSNKCKLAQFINDKNIADAMNNNIISYNDINKFVEGELKPTGHKIFITTVDELIARLEVLNGQLENY